MVNCTNCWYKPTCEIKNKKGLIFCFRKPRCICLTCSQVSICEDKTDGIIACPNYRSDENEAKN